jgi:hypothetical protein
MGLRNVFVAAWLSVSSTILAAAASASPDLPCAGLAPALSVAPGFIRRGDVYIGFDVDSPGVAETGANGINDLGQIAGLYVDTAYHARYCSRQGNYQLINVSLTDGGVAAVATAATVVRLLVVTTRQNLIPTFPAQAGSCWTGTRSPRSPSRPISAPKRQRRISTMPAW